MAPLVFVRPGELRQMEWAEVDLDADNGPQWSIPAEKMKMRVPHIVPLAKQAVAALEELHPLTGSGRYVFPCNRTKGRCMRLGMIPATNKGADELLIKYLRQEVTARARCVPRPGWHPAGGRPAGVYVTPTGEAITVGDVAEMVVLQSDQPPSPIYGQAGDLEGWKESVGKLCVGNSRVVLAISAALAAPLLTPVGLEGGGLHLVGPSSTGKTTALHEVREMYRNFLRLRLDDEYPLPVFFENYVKLDGARVYQGV